MPDFKEHAPGTFCYCELASPDPQGVVFGLHEAREG